ncbi:hypothetical protein OH492_09180 [Vibrio chagasii]|nr:hypothetical protein [Vibrio chagasii]
MSLSEVDLADGSAPAGNPGIDDSSDYLYRELVMMLVISRIDPAQFQ